MNDALRGALHRVSEGRAGDASNAGQTTAPSVFPHHTDDDPSKLRPPPSGASSSRRCPGLCGPSGKTAARSGVNPPIRKPGEDGIFRRCLAARCCIHCGQPLLAHDQDVRV